jgi:hypothetical protein
MAPFAELAEGGEESGQCRAQGRILRIQSSECHISKLGGCYALIATRS